jgi:hypothetical protein
MPDETRHPIGHHPWASLFTRSDARTMRAASWDRVGGNRDWITIEPGQTATLMEHDGPGCVTHFYCTMVDDVRGFRDGILRCYWDGETTPSVEVPLGDFFGLAHGRAREVRSLLTAVNNGNGGSHGLNAYFPMPFANGARMTLENRGTSPLFHGAYWYHIDYEAYDAPPPADVLRLHAQYRQLRPTVAVGEIRNTTHSPAINLDGRDNYVALEAIGSGQMIGLLLEINNIGGGWYGEGDDMVFIDGALWPPAVHGTGTEEVFGAGACPNVEYAGPYSGVHLIESPTFDGLVAMYRWYLPDPIRFSQSIRWTIEHGHANNYANEYSSVAWWYQAEPHGLFPALPSREELLPYLGPDHPAAEQAFAPDRESLGRLVFHRGPEFRAAVNLYARGAWRRAVAELERARRAMNVS